MNIEQINICEDVIINLEMVLELLSVLMERLDESPARQENLAPDMRRCMAICFSERSKVMDAISYFSYQTIEAEIKALKNLVTESFEKENSSAQ